MVRKVTTLICVLAIVLCFSIPTQAASYDPGDFDFYKSAEGEIFSFTYDETVMTWAKGIVNALPVGHDYIFIAKYIEEYREYQYYLVTSDNFNVEESDAWYLCVTSDYANIYTYFKPVNNFDEPRYQSWFDGSCYIEFDPVGGYSSLADMPDLVERSYYVETLNTVLLVVLLLSFVLSAFFRSR